MALPENQKAEHRRRSSKPSPKDEVVLSPDMENVKGAKWLLGLSNSQESRIDPEQRARETSRNLWSGSRVFAGLGLR
jgi:hypothetical protein